MTSPELVPAFAPPYFDTPEAYEAVIPHEETRIVDAGYIPDLRTKCLENLNDAEARSAAAFIAHEETLFGMSVESNPKAFLTAHNQLLDDRQNKLNAMLDPLKTELTGKLATYLAGTEPTRRQEWHDKLSQRLAATIDITIDDYLVSLSIAHAFNYYSRRIDISSFDLVTLSQPGEQTEDYWRFVRDYALSHEILHGMLAAGSQEIEEGELFVLRNGLHTFHWIRDSVGDLDGNDHGHQLSEALIESLRAEITDMPVVAYTVGTAVLQSLDELSPGLRSTLIKGAFGSQGPARAFGSIENLIGPFGIEKLDSLIGDCGSSTQLRKLEECFSAMLPPELRSKGHGLIGKHLQNIARALPPQVADDHKHLLAA